MFDENLVHAIIDGKHLDCGLAELSVNLVLTRGHGSLLLDLQYFRPVRRHPQVIHFLRHVKTAQDGNFLFWRLVLPLLLRAFAPLS